VLHNYNSKDFHMTFESTVHLATEMARSQGLDVGPEAVTFVTDRFRSKLERDACSDNWAAAHGGFLTYRFYKEFLGCEEIVYGRRMTRRVA
jgi:hypothetical protein